MTAQTQVRHSRIVQASPVFYGWIIWFAATVGISATSPGQSYSVSLFIDHYITDFGLDRTSVSGLYGLGTFIASLSLPWVGRRIDRHGNRAMSIAITLLFGVVLLACSLIAGPIAILFSFIAIRGLGQGSLGLVSSTAIAQWYQRQRGWMMGLSLVLFAIFQRFYLPAMQGFIDSEGWRAAWVLSGVTMLVFVLPLMGLLIRDRPEDFGLQPDGTAVTSISSEAPIVEENWQPAEAMRTQLFWAFVFARMLSGAWGTALIFHQISLFEGLGHSAELAATTYGQAALMTAGVTLFAGWLVDRIKPGYLIAMQMAGLAACSGLALIMREESLLFLYTVAFGIFMGVGSVFDGTVWVNLFGRLHQGAIRGFVATAIVMGTAIGPIVFGLSYDYLGGYEASVWLGIVLAGIAALWGLMVKLPSKSS